MYEVGQEVVIVHNYYNHHFAIGETVKVRTLDSNRNIYCCESLDGSQHWLIDNDEVVSAGMEDNQ